MPRRNYNLTEKAVDDLREAKAWSMYRWNKELTDSYFDDLHKGAQFVAENHHSLQSREELTGSTGLFLYPVREHDLVYLPIDNKKIIIVSVIRQCRDIKNILKKWNPRIQREISKIKRKIQQGDLTLPE